MLNWKSGKPINGRTAAAIAERIAPQATAYAADYTNLLVRRGITQPDSSLSRGALLLGIEPAVAGGWPELSNFHSLTNLQESELQWFGISVGERYLYLSLSHQRAR